MRLVSILTLAAILLAGAPSSPGAEEASAPALPPATNAVPAADAATNAAAPALWFPVGEELHYYLFWTKIMVGRTSIYTAWTQDAGRPLLQVTYVTRSNRTLSKLYPVDDKIVVRIDPATFLPVTFDVDLKEGKFLRRETTVFDYERKIAMWSSAVKNKVRTFPIEADTRDLVTFMYYLRAKGFRLGEDRNTRVMADDKIYDLNIKVPAAERVELPRYGRVTCLRLEPTAQFEGIFVRSGQVSLWVSRDPRNICTRLAAQVPVGSVHAELMQVRGPGQDFWVAPPITNAPARKP